MNGVETFTPKSRRYLAACRKIDNLNKAVGSLDLEVYGMAYGSYDLNAAKARKTIERILGIVNSLNKDLVDGVKH